MSYTQHTNGLATILLPEGNKCPWGPELCACEACRNSLEGVYSGPCEQAKRCRSCNEPQPEEERASGAGIEEDGSYICAQCWYDRRVFDESRKLADLRRIDQAKADDEKLVKTLQGVGAKPPTQLARE